MVSNRTRKTRGLWRRASLGAVFFVLLVGLTTPTVYGASVSDLQKQQQQLKEEIQRNQELANQKAAEAKTLSGQIDSLNGDITATQDKIDETSGQISQVNGEIAALAKQVEATRKQLDAENKKLDSTLVELYRITNGASYRSTLFMLLSSNDLASTMEGGTHLTALQQQIDGKITEVQKIKEEFERQNAEQKAKKDDLAKLQSQQEAQKRSATAQKSYKDSLLDMTEDQKATYEARVKQTQGEYARVSEQVRQILLKSAEGSSGSSSGSLGYPWAGAVKDAYGDPYGFLVRECTSYVAWRWNSRGWNWYRNTDPWWSQFNNCGGGDAKNWACVARARGMAVGSTPASDAIAVWTFGQYGHVAYVESVSGDYMTISDYNAVPPFGGQGNTRTINIYNSSMGAAQYIYH